MSSEVEIKFADFYKKQFRKIFIYVYERVPKKEDVEDIVADSFSVIWNAYSDKSKDELELIKILYGVVRNKIADYLRNVYKLTFIELESKVLNEFPEVKETQSTNSSSNFSILKHIINLLKEDLNEKERLLYEVKYVENMTYRQISEVMGITENNAKVINNRLLKKLKNLWMKKQN